MMSIRVAAAAAAKLSRNAAKPRLSRVLGRTMAFQTAAAPPTAFHSTQSKTAAVVVAAVALLLSTAEKTHNHCQVPCGIFDDPAMVAEVKQAAKTIRKACVETQALANARPSGQTMNQIVRWILTKEQHCDKIISTIGEYCLCQRVKQGAFSSDADYLHALQLHHTVMQCAMKAKQSTSLDTCDELDHALEDLGKMYS